MALRKWNKPSELTNDRSLVLKFLAPLDQPNGDAYVYTPERQSLDPAKSAMITDLNESAKDKLGVYLDEKFLQRRCAIFGYAYNSTCNFPITQLVISLSFGFRWEFNTIQSSLDQLLTEYLHVSHTLLKSLTYNRILVAPSSPTPL